MKFITVALCFLLTSCSYHDVYPNKWANIIDSKNISYNNLSGEYRDVGSDSERFSNKISAILNLTKNEKEPVDKIKISQEECDLVTISSWYKDSLLGSKSFSKRDVNLECNKNGLNIKLPVVIVADIYFGTQWDNLTLLKATDESLIVNHTSSGVGTIFIIPVGGTVSNWYRLVKITN